LRETIFTSENVSLVFDYIETNLKVIIRDNFRPQNDTMIRHFFVQLLRGIAHLHALKIMHRVRDFEIVLKVVSSGPKTRKHSDNLGRNCKNRRLWTSVFVFGLRSLSNIQPSGKFYLFYSTIQLILGRNTLVPSSRASIWISQLRLEDRYLGFWLHPGRIPEWFSVI
jgi:hypothetical protein